MLLRIVLRRDVAVELFQDLFVRLAGSAGFAAATDPTAYAYRAAINLARDWRRQRAGPFNRGGDVRGPWTGSITDPVADRAADPPADFPADREELDRVLTAVMRLGQPARDAVCLRYLSQMSYDEVGRSIGRTAHQARAICHAAIVRVRKELATERSPDHAEPSRR